MVCQWAWRTQGTHVTLRSTACFAASLGFLAKLGQKKGVSDFPLQNMAIYEACLRQLGGSSPDSQDLSQSLVNDYKVTQLKEAPSRCLYQAKIS